jgi:hypothetical protein
VGEPAVFRHSVRYDRQVMKSSLAMFVVLAIAVPLSAQQSWTGQISDSMCKTKHEEAAEGQGKMPDKDCTLSCVKGGSKFVLVADGKVLQIANQDRAELTTLAGQVVTMTGTLKGDTITVATIEAAAKKH